MITKAQKEAWLEISANYFRSRFTSDKELLKALIDRECICVDPECKIKLADQNQNLVVVLRSIDSKYALVQTDDRLTIQAVEEPMLHDQFGIWKTNQDRSLQDLREGGVYTDNEMQQMRVSDCLCFGAVIGLTVHELAETALKNRGMEDAEYIQEYKQFVQTELYSRLHHEIQRQRFINFRKRCQILEKDPQIPEDVKHKNKIIQQLMQQDVDALSSEELEKAIADFTTYNTVLQSVKWQMERAQLEEQLNITALNPELSQKLEKFTETSVPTTLMEYENQTRILQNFQDEITANIEYAFALASYSNWLDHIDVKSGLYEPAEKFMRSIHALKNNPQYSAQARNLSDVLVKLEKSVRSIRSKDEIQSDFKQICTDLSKIVKLDDDSSRMFDDLERELINSTTDALSEYEGAFTQLQNTIESTKNKDLTSAAKNITQEITNLKPKFQTFDSLNRLTKLANNLTEALKNPSSQRMSLYKQMNDKYKASSILQPLGGALLSFADAMQQKDHLEVEYQAAVTAVEEAMRKPSAKNQPALLVAAKKILYEVKRNYAIDTKNNKPLDVTYIQILQATRDGLMNTSGFAGIQCLKLGKQLKEDTKWRPTAKALILMGAVLLIGASVGVGLISGGLLLPLSIAGFAVGKGLLGGLTLAGVGTVLAASTTGFGTVTLQSSDKAARKSSATIKAELLKIKNQEVEAQVNALEICEDMASEPIPPYQDWAPQ